MGDVKCVQNFGHENLKGRDHLHNSSTDGRIILKMDCKEIDWEGVDWIHMTHDRDHWQALVNTVLNVGSTKGRGFLDKLRD
jgi:hypothetical protein